MIVSYKWLQSYFSKDIPKPEKLANLLTMHSLEVESVEKKKGDYIIDINVTPNRAHDSLSHLGIAREISAIVGLKLKTEKLKIKSYKLKIDFDIDVKELSLCRRYAGVMIEGVRVKLSPKWLKDRLEAIGQKSINNVVDILNFVMFDVGQPMHAFDADKISGSVVVRKAKNGEKITTLDNQDIELDENILIIADENGPLALAGIKGGKRAEVGSETKNIILEAANFEPINTRKTSRRVGIRNDSSVRFENEISLNLAGQALEKATSLILKEVGGKSSAVKDFYPRKVSQYKLGLHPKDVSSLLGLEVSEKDIVKILKSLSFEVKKIKPIDNILKIAQSLKGKPYKYGASISYDAPEFFDCSSFVSYVFAHSGVQVPRMTIDQYFYGKPIEQKDLKPGDLVFSNTKVLINKIHYESVNFMKGTKIKEGVDHVGLYLGNGKIIYTSSFTGKIVIKDLKKIKEFKNLRGFRRFITEADDLLLVTVPSSRLDVRIKEDLVEEVGRIYGYENIPSVLPESALVLAIRNEGYYLSRKIKDIFVGAGFSEVYNYSFAKRGDIELQNPIAKGKEYLRSSLVEGFLNNVEENLKYFDEVKVFEIGEVFRIDNNGCVSEKKMIGGSIAYKDKKKNKEHEVFYEIKGVLSTLFEKLGILGVRFGDDGEDTALIKYNGNILGIISNFSAQGDPVLGWEIDFDILKSISSEELEYSPVSRYPSAVRDLSIFVPFRTKVEEVLDVIENMAGELLFDTDLFDIYENEERKSFAFRFIFQSYDKTLSDTEINEIMDKVMKALDERPEWEVRKST
ncbi:MAG: phenylalanine--tRNA ligase beta subunit-related protein [Parcubacteria group bacterium]|nr:phenylalanine--tRNA ligase beta subunit-related protein [Parcubacteria group bacterium]MCR4342391.1 phenylalanine--tRNA ligase beta subunit-related protein [Patescibacteria group bacterium]